MSDNSVLFNLIVPTRNRSDTLSSCLQSLLAQTYSNFSVTVSDNCSSDNTREVVESFNDNRLKYINTGRPLCMRENWEFALSQVDDGWVSFIGDDDGLLPGALEHVADVIEQTSVLAVTSSWCRYTWPGAELENADTLILPMTRGVDVRKSDLWRKRVMSGGWRYIELPYIYTGGFVNYSVLRKALSKKPYFFNSMNPDIYSALAVSFLVDEYAFIMDPIALRGTSSHSTGASSFKNNQNDAPRQEFKLQNTDSFHPVLNDEDFPMSMHLFVYESYLQSQFLADDSGAVEPGTGLLQQLEIVAKLSSKRDRFAVRNYCARVLERAGAMGSIGLMGRLRVLFVRPLYLFVEIRRVLNSRLLDASASGVCNVYEAGVFARSIHWYEANRSFGKIRRLLATLRSHR